MKKWISIFCLLFPAINCFATDAKPVMAKSGMVVSEQKLASDVGRDILRQGGNAIDAAVAVGYALAVVDPCCGNIGGGGFMTIHLADGKNVFINFREKAPLAAKTNLFLDKKGNLIPNKSTQGYLAVGVPGTPLGLETALKKYGTMTRQTVMAPAIRLARKGYVLTPYDAALIAKYQTQFMQQENVAAIFLKKNQPPKANTRLVQTDLANTLKNLADEGPTYFYNGPIAATIVENSKAHGGILKLKDFEDYTVQELAPVTCTYRGYTIISAPPPSSGGVTLCEMTNILEKYPLETYGLLSAESVHYMTEAMRIAFRDRNNQLGDPDFISNPTEKLTSKPYAEKVRQKILESKATPDAYTSVAIPHESTNTTHYSVIDKFGNAVSVTYTLNSYFGAGVIAGNTGFFLNDEMDDFATKPGTANQFGLVQGKANAIQPGKRPLSSMTPTIVTKNQKVFLVLGSPGGPRIITATLEAILNVIDYKMNILAAIDAPRFHHQWQPDRIDTEPQAFSKETTEKLIAMGYQVNPLPTTWSAVEAILVDPETGIIYGANDIRRPSGKASGY